MDRESENVIKFQLSISSSIHFWEKWNNSIIREPHKKRIHIQVNVRAEKKSPLN